MYKSLLILSFSVLPFFINAQFAGDYAPSYYQLIAEGGIVGCEALESRGGQFFVSNQATPYNGHCIQRVIFGSQHLVLTRVGISRGVRHGSLEEWHANGIQKTRGTYEFGELQGLYEAWHPNGTLAARYTYVDNLIDGIAENWNEVGILQIRGEYRAGERYGYYEEWDDNGVDSTRECYISDSLQPVTECSRLGVY